MSGETAACSGWGPVAKGSSSFTSNRLNLLAEDEVKEEDPFVTDAIEITMTSTPSRRVSVTHHRRARLPGTFGSDEEFSPVKVRFNGRDINSSSDPDSPTSPIRLTAADMARSSSERGLSERGSPETVNNSRDHDSEGAADGDVEELASDHDEQKTRPKILQTRQHSQSLSYSSNTTTSTDTTSEATVGADFALQSGGAVPNEDSTTRPMDLSRTISLGSIASGISDLMEGDASLDRPNVDETFNDGGLAQLEADELNSSVIDVHRGRQNSSSPATPRAASQTPTVSTVTGAVRQALIANTPSTSQAQTQPRQNARASSPTKRSGMPISSFGRNIRNLTLKEQSSTIERLGKENWDLKVKIWCLEKNLNTRSEEGVSELIAANVELRTDKLKMQRETRELRRTIRELERKVKERDEIINKAKADEAGRTKGSGRAVSDADFEELEAEVTYLRERSKTYQVEIEKLRSEGTAREGEHRRLAGVVKTMGARRSSEGDIGLREEMDMWKDLLESETARREQTDEDNRKLREEIARLRSDTSSTTTNNHNSNVYHVKKRQHKSSVALYSSESDRAMDRKGVTSAASSHTLVENLRHENAELRREVAAQTSMLTSRNKERERLYQDVEELKLQRRGDGLRSVAGDSIFERSASRAHNRPASGESEGTRITQLSDAERDRYEAKNGELRDQISELKLKNQELSRKAKDALVDLDEAKAAIADYEAMTNKLDEELDQAASECHTMETERDQALQANEELDAEFGDLKAEAQQTIDELELELESRTAKLQKSEEEHETLQSEVRMLREGINVIENEAAKNAKRVEDLQMELEDTNRELESMENRLYEEKSKAERLAVQQESSQSEIAFLREEQDGDKIKIGDLESALKSAQTSLQDEKARVKELDERLAEERQQREVVASKEKQEVQQIINDLNREVSGTKEEARKLKKSLQSREQEATTWKERLMELENSLREALGDLNGTRSSLLKSITKLQKELDSTASELDITKSNLAEKDRLLKSRDALLESHGLESRKLGDLLEKERQARRNEKHQHEQWQKSHKHTTRTVSQKETRIVELESARQADRKKLSSLEQQYQAQLRERNNLLLAMWNRLSTICGSDWQHKHSLVNGSLPSLEVVASMLPSFSKNLLLAMKAVEALIGGFKNRIRSVERELWKEYQSLEHNVDVGNQRLDRLEKAVQSTRSDISQGASSDVAKLKGENRLLKAELSTLRKQEPKPRSGRGEQRSSNTPSREVSRSAMAATLMRHHSSSAVEALERASDVATIPITSAPIEPSQQRWIHRLRELERRLKAEREARLVDRSGARKRLEEGLQENEQLRMELERERVRRGR